MQTEETIETKQESNIFNFPRGNLKKEISTGKDLSCQNDGVNTDTNNFIIPQVNLKNYFFVHYEEFEHIDVSIIENYDKVTFNTIGKKKYPILLTDGEKFICIYGGSYVLSAIAAGDHTIRCLVKHVQSLSNRSLAIKSAGLRIKPENDPVTYPEILKAFNVIIAEYEEEGIDTSHVEHGGARRGEAYQEIKEDDFIDNELIPELGRSRSTILDYKSDAMHITDDLFKHVIQYKANKKFFETIRTKKNEAIRSFEEYANKDEHDFTEYLKIIISENIKNCFIEFKLKNTLPDFSLLTNAESEHIKNEIKSTMDQIEKDIEAESEKKRQESLNIVDDEPGDVKFPSFDNHGDDTSSDEDTQLLLAKLKIINDEIGKLLANTAIHNVKSEVLKYKAELLKLMTA